MVSVALVESWDDELTDLFARIAGRFARVEPRKRAFAYVRGLLAPLERRNGWTLAEQAGDGSPDGVQALLCSPGWDADAVRDDVRAYVVERIGDPGGVLIADETCTATQPVTYPSWPKTLRAVRAWLTPWLRLQRWWKAWSDKPPPTELQQFLDALGRGHGINLYLPP